LLGQGQHVLDQPGAEQILLRNAAALGLGQDMVEIFEARMKTGTVSA
jgi:hypothetical protein